MTTNPKIIAILESNEFIKFVPEEERFEMCLKEAHNLKYGVFSPELDNLENQDIASILFKILVEHDLVLENQPHFEDATEDEKHEWRMKVREFFQRWRDWNNKEEEKRMYVNF